MEENEAQSGRQKETSIDLNRSPEAETHSIDLNRSPKNDDVEVSSSSPPPETFMVGFLVVDVVELRHYQRTISGREIVDLVRDPNDQDAVNAVDMRSVPVGRLEPLVAAVLSPLIDAGSITIQGIVPKPQEKGRKFKIQVHISAKIEELEKVKRAIATGALQLISENNASFTLSEPMGEEEKQSVDGIFELLDLKVSNEGMLKALEPPKEIIKSELFLHQKEGLGWLVGRENSCELPPFWEDKNGVYVNELTDNETGRRPEPLRGGIFADDIGLGKTLTLLSLIAYDKWNHTLNSSSNVEDDEKLSEDESIALLDKKSKLGRGTKKTENSRKKKKVVDLEPKTTLIVFPPSILSSWITQLEEHTQKGTFKVYEFYGKRTVSVEELQKHDIVLTTYGALATDLDSNWSPIKEIEWRRVILDEAHVIKNVNSKQSLRVAQLNAKRRWAVTGTPVRNNSFDLFSLVRFLKFKPLSNESLWNSLIQGDEKGFSRLQVLMATICLRRTKDKPFDDSLPSKSIVTCYVELSEEERRVYDQMEEEAKNMIKGYISDNKSEVTNYFTILRILLRLRKVCTDLRLCSADLSDLLSPSETEDVKNNPTSPTDGSFSTSSKVTALIKVLSASRDENPSTKSVIFSQFCEMLPLLEEPLKEAGFKVVRLAGYMDAKRRGRVIKEFGGEGGPIILLASLGSSKAGINLTAASRVYLFEPWWGPAVEEQVIDRVHQIGQKDDVKIVRLIARNSIEERILKLQEKKSVIAKKVSVKKDSKDQKKLSRDDIRALMNLE